MSKQPSQTASIITVVVLGLLVGGSALGMCVCCGMAGLMLELEDSDATPASMTKGHLRTDKTEDFTGVEREVITGSFPAGSPLPHRDIDTDFPPLRTPSPPTPVIPGPRMPMPSIRPPTTPPLRPTTPPLRPTTPHNFGRGGMSPRPTPPRFPSRPIGPGFNR